MSITETWAEFRYRVGRGTLLPYPLRATRISVSFQPFGFWLWPAFVHKRDLTEFARAQGEAIWWARWTWFQISYSRWV